MRGYPVAALGVRALLLSDVTHREVAEAPRACLGSLLVSNLKLDSLDSSLVCLKMQTDQTVQNDQTDQGLVRSVTGKISESRQSVPRCQYNECCLSKLQKDLMVIFARKLLSSVWSFWSVWSVCISRHTSKLTKLTKVRFNGPSGRQSPGAFPRLHGALHLIVVARRHQARQREYPCKGVKTRDHMTYLVMRHPG